MVFGRNQVWDSTLASGKGGWKPMTQPGAITPLPPITSFDAPASVTVGTSSTPIVAASATTRTISVQNLSDEEIYLAFDGETAVVGKGKMLTPYGGVYQADNNQSAIVGICASGGKEVAVQRSE